MRFTELAVFQKRLIFEDMPVVEYKFCSNTHFATLTPLDSHMMCLFE